ncbi:MAG: EAL domain-containing protein [Planctomycetota bacterium]
MSDADEELKIFKILFSEIRDLAYVTDTHGNIRFVNKAFAHLTGHKPEAFFGKPFTPLFDEENLKKAVDIYTRTLQGECLEFELRFKETGVICEYRSRPLKNETGEVVGTIGIARDVTERKRNQAIEYLFHEIDQLALHGQSLDYILPYVCLRFIAVFAYPLVWIGMKELDGTVSISAQAGGHADYLKELKVRWEDAGKEPCLIGRAIRSGLTHVCDYDNPTCQHCRERAYTYGLQSFIAVPLLAQGRVLGSLNLYAQRPGVFDAGAISRLENLAARISVTMLLAIDQQQLRLQGTAMASVANAVFITDSDGNIDWVNDAFTKLSGYTLAEVCGKTPRVFKSGKHEADYYRKVWREVLAGNVWRGEVINRHKDGRLYTVNQTITPLLDTQGKVSHFVAIHEDVTAQKEAESRIRHMAHFDALTNLPNRTLFIDRLQQELVRAYRSKRLVAVLFLDLDRFKIINDTMGHAFGDTLLKALAERLKNCIRESDTVSRRGGDEFTFTITDLSDPQDVAPLAQKIIEAVSPPFQIENHEINVTCSVGIAVYPFDASNAEDLIKKADIAMYHAKEQGRNNFKFYREEINANSMEKMKLGNSLQRALNNGELLLYYQPQIDLHTGKIIGMEALARWQHPDLGMISPSKFIPIAEEFGLISMIGEWVLTTACAQTRRWQNAGFSTLRVTVNLSARQFEQKDFCKTVFTALEKTRLDPHYLELEIAEGNILQNIEAVIAVLEELRALGIQLSIDDFGTKYSSLSYLRKIHFNTLKIDRSFLENITTNPDDAAIISAIITIAERLKINVVAEGVENNDQVSLLHELRCDKIQGFVHSPPLSVNDMEKYLLKGCWL